MVGFPDDMLSPRVRQVGLIAIFVVAIFAIGAALYFAFFRGVVSPPPNTTPGGTTTPGSGTLPGAGTGTRPPTGSVSGNGQLTPADTVARGGVTQTTTLTTGGIKGLAVTAAGANYYDPNDGRFYRVDSNGNLIKLSDAQFPQASDVSWNTAANKAVIEFPDGNNVVYDFATQTQTTLPSQWEDFEFSPANDSIVAKSIGVDPNNRYLVVSNADGSNVKPIQALGFNANKVQVAPSSTGQVVAFADTAEPLSGGLDRKLILPIGMNNENFKGITVEGLGFVPNWSPDGNRLLYSASGAGSNYKPTLWIVDASPANMGENRRAIGLNTWADKCTFAGTSTVYCAVPKFLQDNVGLQRALADGTPDALFKIDLANGGTSLVAVPETDTSMINLSVSPDGGSLFFTNAITGRLETIRLR